MTEQVRILPGNDSDLYMAYLIMGANYSRTARSYGADESSVRRRIQRFLRSSSDLPKLL